MQSFKANMLSELLIQVSWNTAVRKNERCIINQFILDKKKSLHLLAAELELLQLYVAADFGARASKERRKYVHMSRAVPQFWSQFLPILLFPCLPPEVAGVIAPAQIPAEIKPDICIASVRHYIPAHPHMPRDRKDLWGLLHLHPHVSYS